ncbi:uncharacterized protein LOC112880421 isoform X2 [Panicum hallii]|uniref:uncharacterized protein LOC112880421 isoform X2 n=1 Tax=Panicum hallii TaxID=206008 RepID=UPI000DF4EC22|nr:uncharacterized protein LOC112880421 isoform X2 [Panicum hallii]
MRLAFGLGRASPGGPLTMQFAVLHSFSVPPSSSPPSPEKSPMSRAAAARKLAGISQLRAPPASTGGLLYRSYGGGSSGSRKGSLPRRVLSIGAISLAGGLVLSAVNDLAIFHGCTTSKRCDFFPHQNGMGMGTAKFGQFPQNKAIEKAADNQKVIEAIGVPLVRGPWYEASLEVGHRRRSVSCAFPVSGPHGSGFFQIEATRNGEDGLLSFLRHHDWEIITLEAHLHVPSDDEQQKTIVKLNLESNGGGQCGEPERES